MANRRGVHCRHAPAPRVSRPSAAPRRSAAQSVSRSRDSGPRDPRALAAEALRRALDEEASDYWPYVEAIHSNISEFEYRRGEYRPSRPLLVAGDSVIFDVRAVNPRGPESDFQFGVLLAVNDSIGSYQWSDASTIETIAPEGRKVQWGVGVTTTALRQQRWTPSFSPAQFGRSSTTTSHLRSSGHIAAAPRCPALRAPALGHDCGQ